MSRTLEGCALLVLLPALLLASAAAPLPSESPAPRRYGHLFISPMGEPFWGSAPGDDALADWFRQADVSHDGVLTVDELARDADRFFGTLDRDHDGEIDPDEVDHYELVVAPAVQGEPMSMREVPHTGEDAGAGIDSNDADMGISGGGADGPQGAGGFSLLNIPEPVTGADANIDRSVSRDEFRRAAVERFQLLDASHSGRLTLAELEAMRPSPPLGGFRRHHNHGRSRPGAAEISPIKR